jgi:hypothetical protein
MLTTTPDPAVTDLFHSIMSNNHIARSSRAVATVTAPTDIVTPSMLPVAFLEQEKIIETHGLKAFIAVGNALMTINQMFADERGKQENEQPLHKCYDTFEKYCSVRWDMTRQYAYDHINAAIDHEVHGIELSNEKQYRALSPLKDPLLKLAAVRLAEDSASKLNQRLTGALIECAVETVIEDQRTGKVDVEGTMLASTSSVIAKHFERVQSHIDNHKTATAIKNGIIVPILKGAQCKIVDATPTGDVTFHFANPNDAHILLEMLQNNNFGALSMGLTQRKASDTDSPITTTVD